MKYNLKLIQTLDGESVVYIDVNFDDFSALQFWIEGFEAAEQLHENHSGKTFKRVIESM